MDCPIRGLAPLDERKTILDVGIIQDGISTLELSFVIYLFEIGYLRY